MKEKRKMDNIDKILFTFGWIIDLCEKIPKSIPKIIRVMIIFISVLVWFPIGAPLFLIAFVIFGIKEVYELSD